MKHEKWHANQQVPAGSPADPDLDNCESDLELMGMCTDPHEPYSAVEDLNDPTIVDTDDGEAYAGGIIEQIAIETADTSNDWAYPGTNWN